MLAPLAHASAAAMVDQNDFFYDEDRFNFVFSKYSKSSQRQLVIRMLRLHRLFGVLKDGKGQKDRKQHKEKKQRGMSVSSGLCKLEKDTNNLVGVSIGGGSPHCPCLYIVQIFDNTPAHKEGSLEAGDEITGINKQSVKGMSKQQVARMIQGSNGPVIIQYNKLHADPKSGKSLDIVLKKLKHKIVENVSADTADALGMSRAILCNDSMVKKLNELEQTAEMYRGLIDNVRRVWRSYYNIARVQKAFGDLFAEIGAREPQQNASEAFSVFGESHREMEKRTVKLLRVLRPMVNDLSTFLDKAIPDTKMTIKRYLDVKFEYLSYCLKLKEMDDEEAQFVQMSEPLYRLETGNYEYRLVLRCRQDARQRFAALRNDVLVKLELLDQKHVQDISFQLQRFVAAMVHYHNDSNECIGPTRGLFPIEVDLSQVAVKYNTTGQLPPDDDTYTDDEVEDAAEATTVGHGGDQDDDDCLLDLAALSADEPAAPTEADALDQLMALNGPPPPAQQKETAKTNGAATDDMIDLLN